MDLTLAPLTKRFSAFAKSLGFFPIIIIIFLPMSPPLYALIGLWGRNSLLIGLHL